jgi:dihydroxy-acid dehydratase
VPSDELARRHERLRPLQTPAGCGWLSVYARSVSPLHQGATLGG